LKKFTGAFKNDYQRWYTESCALIRQIIPERLAEFELLYKGDNRRKNVEDVDELTYTIQDLLLGLRANMFAYFGVVVKRFETQLQILKSAESRFESTLFDIKQMVQADLFDSELDTAQELLKKGFLRAAGVVSGVVLEAHLSQVCTNHGISTRKKNPTI